MKISEIMTPVSVLPPETPVREAAELIKEQDVSLIPIGSGEQIEGVVTPRDIAVSAAAHGCKPERQPLEDIATQVMAFCQEGQELPEVLAAMQAHHQTRLLVRDAGGMVSGVVTLEDIVRACPVEAAAG